MTNLARGAKIVALLLFILPWVTISCAEQTLVSMSGVDLASGSVTMNNPAPPGSTAPSPDNPFDQPNMAVIAAALLIAARTDRRLPHQGPDRLDGAIGLRRRRGRGLAYTVFVRYSGHDARQRGLPRAMAIRKWPG